MESAAPAAGSMVDAAALHRRRSPRRGTCGGAPHRSRAGALDHGHHRLSARPDHCGDDGHGGLGLRELASVARGGGAVGRLRRGLHCGPEPLDGVPHAAGSVAWLPNAAKPASGRRHGTVWSLDGRMRAGTGACVPDVSRAAAACRARREPDRTARCLAGGAPQAEAAPDAPDAGRRGLFRRPALHGRGRSGSGGRRGRGTVAPRITLGSRAHAPAGSRHAVGVRHRRGIVHVPAERRDRGAHSHLPQPSPCAAGRHRHRPVASWARAPRQSRRVCRHGRHEPSGHDRGTAPARPRHCRTLAGRGGSWISGSGRSRPTGRRFRILRRGRRAHRRQAASLGVAGRACGPRLRSARAHLVMAPRPRRFPARCHGTR